MGIGDSCDTRGLGELATHLSAVTDTQFLGVLVSKLTANDGYVL